MKSSTAVQALRLDRKSSMRHTKLAALRLLTPRQPLPLYVSGTCILGGDGEMGGTVSFGGSKIVANSLTPSGPGDLGTSVPVSLKFPKKATVCGVRKSRPQLLTGLGLRISWHHQRPRWCNARVPHLLPPLRHPCCDTFCRRCINCRPVFSHHPSFPYNLLVIPATTTPFSSHDR